MQVINQSAHTNKDGVLTITIPTDLSDTDVELVVVINPVNTAAGKKELSHEEILMLEERWEEYQKNPGASSSWEEVKKSISKKYGI
ncbi:MAG: hypothetical protein JNL24_05575 [Bacteroidia bacterium]|nr:hypothetical protein [Bacteroidia bacterium]